MRSASKAFFACLLTLGIYGCGDSGTTTAGNTGNGSTGTTTNVTIAVTPTATQTIDAGQSVPLTATVTGDSSNRGVTWTVAAGSGTLANTTGLTNTYTAPSTAAPTVTVTAASILDPTKTASVNIVVNALPSFISTGQLAQGFVGVAYSASLTSAGGTGARTYSLGSGNFLPAGLTLNGTTGVISGTPTTAGSTTFAAVVTDGAGTPLSATASFTIGISALQVTAPTFTSTVVGRTYPASTYTTAFAQGAVTYAVTNGALPAGLTLSSSGVVSGTASGAGSSTFTVTATDSVGQRSTATSTIVVASQLSLTGTTLQSTTANTAFIAYTVTATGGTAPYTYAVAAGSVLPAGLNLSSAGVLSGTPTTAGSYTFSITASDSGGATTANSQTATAVYNLTVTVPALVFSTTVLPNAVANTAYSQSLLSSGGVSPYTYTITGGTLPAGITLSPGGILSGRGTAAGNYTFTVKVTDTENTPQTASRTLMLAVVSNVTPGPNNALLNGGYAFIYTGQSNGALASGASTSGTVYGADIAGTLKFDGSSTVTGVVDYNSAIGGVISAVPVTGTYTLGSDNRGQVVLTYNNNTAAITLSIAASNIANGAAGKLRLINVDSDNANNLTQVQGDGEAWLQTASAFTSASLNGRYVFRLYGETPSPSALNNLNQSQPGASSQFGPLGAVGYLALNGAGLITRGVVDASSYSTSYNQLSVSGSYTAPDTNGRGTLTVTPVSSNYPGAPTHYNYYVVNGKQLVLMSTDSHSTQSLMAGSAYQQQQSIYSTASITGTVIGYENTLRGGNGTTTYPSTFQAILYNFRVTSPGNMSAYSAGNTNGTTTTYVNSPDPLTYTVSDAGRVTFVDLAAPTEKLPVFWLYDVNTGVGTEFATSAGPVGTIGLEAQTGTSFDLGSISGTYAQVTTASQAPLLYSVGSISTDTSSAATITEDISNNATISTGVSSALTKAVETTTGRFTFTNNDVFYNGFILSPTKIVFFNALPGFTKPVIRIAEK